MVKRSQRMCLFDMAEQIAAIEAAMIGRSLTDLQSNWMLRQAVERGIEIISEASRHVDQALLGSIQRCRGDEWPIRAIGCAMAITRWNPR